MGAFEWPGFLIGLILFLIIGYLIAQRNIPSIYGDVIRNSLLLRIVGVIGYAFIVFAIYGGGADPVVYMRWGLRFADYFRQFDFAPLYDPDVWRGPFIGTNFVGYPAALITLVTGDSYRGAWLVYSLFCLIGLYYFGKVFFRAYGPLEYKNYLNILLIYPSLWFWTASISKDSWMIFGVAIFMTGMLDAKKRQNILVMALGLLWCYMVRPQVAAMLAFAAAGAYFLVSLKQLNFKNIMVIIVSTIGAFYILNVLGVGGGIGDIQQFAEGERNRSEYGGSVIQLTTGPFAYVFGPINILFRPFPWEVGGLLQAISFFDVYFIWFLALKNRKAVFRSIKMIRKDRLVAFCLVFILLFSVGAGLTLSNLGLIARQRIILYPFMFWIIYAYSDKRIAFLNMKRKERYQKKLDEIARIQQA